jgi:hypothetical protein
MHFTQEQRDAWAAETRDSPFNLWLRHRTTGPDGGLDLELMRQVAQEYGIDADRYAHLNPGQQRMNVGNRLRRAVPAEVYGSTQKQPNEIEPAVCEQTGFSPDVRWGFMQSAGVVELLQMQAAAIEELRRRKVVRTSNAPLGDYAEHLFACAFGWTLSPNSGAGHDAVCGAGTRYQIKARRLRDDVPGERQLGILRGLPDGSFDHLAAILFDADFSVRRAAVIPHAVVAGRASRTSHVNGWRFTLDDAVWTLPGVRDVTGDVRAAAAAYMGETSIA